MGTLWIPIIFRTSRLTSGRTIRGGLLAQRLSFHHAVRMVAIHMVVGRTQLIQSMLTAPTTPAMRPSDLTRATTTRTGRTFRTPSGKQVSKLRWRGRWSPIMVVDIRIDYAQRQKV